MSGRDVKRPSAGRPEESDLRDKVIIRHFMNGLSTQEIVRRMERVWPMSDNIVRNVIRKAMMKDE